MTTRHTPLHSPIRDLSATPPYDRSKQNGNRRNSPSTEPVEHSKQRPGVFLLSDRTSISQQIEAALRYSGYFQFLGSSAALSSDRGEEIEIAPDFCLIDLNLRKLAQRVEKRRASFPEEWFVLLYTRGQEELALDLLLAGADGCIDLEAAADSIVVSLREILGGGTPIPAQVSTRVLHLARSGHTFNNACDKLSRREKQIVDLLAKGALYKQIAEHLGISIDTVRRHITNLYRKLEVRSRTEAVLKCFSGRSQNS